MHVDTARGQDPDSAMLASTTEFATSRLWNAVTGPVPVTIAAIPEPERPEIPFVPSFAPDGRTLYVGSDYPMTWSLDPAAWRAAACTIAGRELTTNEWARYLPDRRVRSICPR